MKRRLFVAWMLIALGIVCAWAEERSEREAEMYAMRFLITHYNGQFDESEFKLQGELNGLYVFSISDEGGFVIVSNDDYAIPILGFSDNGTLDLNNMPDIQRAWLQGYADEISWLKQHPIKQSGTGTNARTRTGSHDTKPIAPLITTAWNQHSPYNDLCPDYTTGKRAVTGCVATAMAQVMNYHKWPIAATEVIPEYRDGYGAYHSSLEATTFDWDRMQNSYNGYETPEQKTAVAKLMQYCGYSVEMNYGPSSGASIFKMAQALKNYFDYKGTTTYISRSFYSYEKWEDIIYHELASNRPVLYGGQSTGGGHAFVCDGYKYEYGTDYFHINWGWGGYSDEYYVLSVLNPYSGQGIGGSSSNGGFYFGQEAIIGIQKPSDKGTLADITPAKVNLIPNSMTLSSNTVIWGETVTITLNLTNNSSDDYDGDIYVGITGSLLVGDNFSIPAGQTKDCILTYKPTAIRTYDLSFYEPRDDGYYERKGGILATLTVVDETPTDLAISEISTTSATLSWTQAGTVASWIVAYKAASDADFTEVNADTNTFTLTDLTPETQYTVKVRPDIGEVIKWSSPVTFTTETLRMAPENLTVSQITSTSALVSWEGSADSYDIRYGLAPDISISSDISEWLKYDDDDTSMIIPNGFGLTETTWGVMFPGSMVLGNKLTKIAIYETSLNTENIIVNIYSGGDNAPGELRHTEAVTPTGNNGFHEVTLAPSVTITAGESLWITLTSKGQYPVACYQSSSITPNNQWLYYNNKWYVTGDLVPNFDYGWRIRGFIESEIQEAIDWSSPINCTEQSFNLTGLASDKNYIVQVRGKYGNEDYSNWEAQTFSTYEDVALADNATNSPIVESHDEKEVCVSLTNRTLYKDGKWSTICLPFPLGDATASDGHHFDGTPLSGAIVKELDVEKGSYEHPTGLAEDGTLYLNFKPANSIVAGTPYIIKWVNDTEQPSILSPVFNGVTIYKDKHDVSFSGGMFIGTYDSLSFDGENKSILFLGTDNTLYYPQPDLTDPDNPQNPTIGAQRAYFELGDGVQSIVLDFGDGEQTVNIVDAKLRPSSLESENGCRWYSLDGRRLKGKPTTKGLYINNSRKVVIL